MDQPISLDTVIGFLVSTPLFEALDAAERAEVVRIMLVQRLQRGEQLFAEGQAGDAWYVIFEGQAEVVKATQTGETRRLALLEPGACFGEMAILDGSARSATVQAAGPLTVFRFRRAPFEELLEQGSLAAFKLVAAMARVLSQRHRTLTQQLSELLSPDAAPSARAELGGLVDRYKLSE
jgi:CRP-like cAMP-binding protein